MTGVTGIQLDEVGYEKHTNPANRVSMAENEWEDPVLS